MVNVVLTRKLVLRRKGQKQVIEELIARAIKQSEVSNSFDRVFDHGDIVTVEPFPGAPKQAGKLCGMIEGKVRKRRKAA